MTPYVEIVGGSEKAQKYADVIYEWSLCDLFCVKNLFTGSHPTPKLQAKLGLILQILMSEI